ncbi:DNA glycosylase AlkZ-like family protein, partial [Aeromonas media]|uniref:DNA glycosylase AlkZ-like family protein n=1 Tax=Aeromonas media TaxID=651 RepID=UPI001F11A68F
MSIPHLSLQDARHLQLAAQGLLTPRRAKASPSDLLACIRRMALLQIDTISVVARSPYLVLFSRLGHYDPRWLEQLLAEGDLFEYWAHEACFVPREDYRLLRHRMLDPAAMGWKFSAHWL